MQVDIRHGPAFGVARLQLAGREAVRVEAGAMMATSAGVQLEAKMQGGLVKSLKRSMLGGESLYVTTYTAPDEGGWVDVAANLPGDLVVREVEPERALVVSRGSWLASGAGIELDTKWGGARNLFGGEGGFLVHAAGRGPVVVACYGALEVVTLGDGERLVLDTGHMVAYEDSMAYELRRASGNVQSLKSREGLVFEFRGPGQVLTQTRDPNALITWLTTVLPFSRA